VTEYLLTVYQPDGPRPAPEAMRQIEAALHELNAQLRASGSWVFTGGLHPPDRATVVGRNGLVTDGPYVEGKEHIGGIWVIRADDLDAALGWGRRAAAATGLPIEIRPFQDVEPF
jgi:hypothetical protein